MTATNSSAAEALQDRPLSVEKANAEDYSASPAPDFMQNYHFPTATDNSLKIAGRLNASQISPKEHQALLGERQELLRKKLAGGLDRRQANRLEYVRWSLDRIEDAKHGSTLDVIEGVVLRYKAAYQELVQLRSGLAGDVVANQSSLRDRQKQFIKPRAS